ncbi:gamma-glutamyl-gamma-aminobutyrate hydrolase family protein [Aerococcus kribbianus]|uniref:Gamma-glutamyl-gamma-aminobutyrate hydrolase family protein n=1 Tax=Aerococcus kribbianus TaxID=2999064 RepID=A0A9X3JF98_9LACT|nr:MULTISPECIES: gamma-glutamyl-gamma-aminobutyrate hydrolase family protein [unclassified Aerococcus]MCZ0716857.1 gamma-glutamyl-gamma-aminobutyrate hydrolase family protein [Aerococcus sp. YH-aer221]MCZ0725145.1 gamma-glutamyl-gamma-aminobutyrate hydrolase family protein [Aerococcus sp. YH-aer222]
MTKPIIGVTSGENTLFTTDTFKGSNSSYTLTNVTDAILKAGGIPVIIPIHDPQLSSHYIASVDGLLLAGGADVCPSWYGQSQSSKLGTVDQARDQRELALIEAAIDQHLPILGICRGLQIMNVYLGGSLYQDLSESSNKVLSHNQIERMGDLVHDLTLDRHSQMHHLLGQSSRVNSIHHQAIDQLGQSLEVTAWSSDQVIEAVESTSEELDFLGVQYHPESLVETYPDHLAIFTDLMARAMQHKTNQVSHKFIYS